MKRLTISMLIGTALFAVSTACAAQAQSEQKGDSLPPFPAAPTLKDLERWFKRELPRMGNDSIVTRGPTGTQWGMKYDLDNIRLTGCTLAFRDVELMSPSSTRGISAATIPLNELDVGVLRVTEAANGPGFTSSKPWYQVHLLARPGRDSAFTVQSVGYGPGTTTRHQRWFPVTIRELASAEQVIAAIRRAAVLCGSPNVPVRLIVDASPVTRSAAANPSSTSTPSANAPKRMTNGDVIEMVSAGLSDSVVATSVRQASGRDFDLSPAGLIALKKAKVSDQVISAMQRAYGPAAPVQAPASPKYDPSLAVPPAAPSNNVCSGVEMMGLYKNDALPTAIGGGVVQWLAKVRNNTGVTKIVAFSWTDMYGQTKQSQVQVRGGEIATAELDVTQARVIAPVSNLRLVSCQ